MSGRQEGPDVIPARPPGDTAPTAEGNCLTAALDYAAGGWYVFPCNGKRPLTENGQDDATIDPDKIREWWARWPNANVAIAAKPSKLLPIDVDPRHGGSVEALRDLGIDTGTRASETGADGRHLFYRQPDGAHLGSSRGALPGGIDVKGNGYVIAPPSIHPDTGRRYHWLNGHEVIEAPARLVDCARRGASPRAPRSLGPLPPTPLPMRWRHCTPRWRRCGPPRREVVSTTTG